jgi:hypothetical protein
MNPRLGTLLVRCGLAMGSVGCFFEASTDPGPPPVIVEPAPSQLTIRWTIDEVADPNVCSMGSTSDIDIVVTSMSGEPSGEFQARCEAFSTTISTLPAGDYQATARLIDSGGTVRTTPVSMAPFTLISGSNLVLDIDFPAASFR